MYLQFSLAPLYDIIDSKIMFKSFKNRKIQLKLTKQISLWCIIVSYKVLPFVIKGNFCFIKFVKFINLYFHWKRSLMIHYINRKNASMVNIFHNILLQRQSLKSLILYVWKNIECKLFFSTEAFDVCTSHRNIFVHWCVALSMAKNTQ